LVNFTTKTFFELKNYNNNNNSKNLKEVINEKGTGKVKVGEE